MERATKLSSNNTHFQPTTKKKRHRIGCMVSIKMHLTPTLSESIRESGMDGYLTTIAAHTYTTYYMCHVIFVPFYQMCNRCDQFFFFVLHVSDYQHEPEIIYEIHGNIGELHLITGNMNIAPLLIEHI